jgi:hypothetical protein
MEYYIYQTEVDANACITYINSTDWFPLIGNVNSTPSPENQMTTAWCTEANETISGEWAVPRVPTSRLDFLGVSQDDRDQFLAAFGQDIRELDSTDFPVEVL